MRSTGQLGRLLAFVSFVPLAFSAILFAQGCGLLTNAPVTGCVANFSGPEVLGEEVSLTDNVTELAESFTVATAGAPGNIQLKLKAIGTPTGNLYLKIEADASGQPSKVVIETTSLNTATIAAAPAADAYYNFVYTTPQTLAAGKYWMILYGNSNFTSTLGVDWMATNVTGAYSGTLSLSTNDTTWTSSAVANRATLFLMGC